MSSEKYKEIKAMAAEDLQLELEASVAQLQKMKFNNAVTGLENPLLIRELRRDVARIKTELRRRQLAELPQSELDKRSKIRLRRRK